MKDSYNAKDKGKGEHTPDAGEVVSITWATGGTSQVTIPAPDVHASGTWYAVYTWSDGDEVLTLAKPTQTKPKPPPPISSKNQGDITKLVITTWGASPLKTPLQWTGNQQGIATIRFVDPAQTSGPVGAVDGP